MIAHGSFYFCNALPSEDDVDAIVLIVNFPLNISLGDVLIMDYKKLDMTRLYIFMKKAVDENKSVVLVGDSETLESIKTYYEEREMMDLESIHTFYEEQEESSCDMEFEDDDWDDDDINQIIADREMEYAAQVYHLL
ncbi:ORF36 [Plodia interpunctella granulovirus]|uniref:ORF36 n=1 Tax=Plodia interpunctella granulovirus TaxID=262175 RepID=A0A1L5JHF9_9BBAC|nr:ORF36 [Plodia interpunctella granulovirus]APO13920.1 ORF36 [Plodia interpunctella granulovirus]